MTDINHDPLGKAILDFDNTGINRNIIVHSDISEDDIIPSSYLFRSEEELPKIEQIALEHCFGTVLDVGAAAGPHAKILRSKGLKVDCIEISQGACSYLRKNEFQVYQTDIQSFHEKQYDTILLLMNGIGISGTLSALPKFLSHLKSLLLPGGRIICDSTDVKYLFENEDGSIWVDLASAYYGNFKFQMEYEDQKTKWFDWLYVDFENLKEICRHIDLKVTKLAEENEHYLVKIEHES